MTGSSKKSRQKLKKKPLWSLSSLTAIVLAQATKSKFQGKPWFALWYSAWGRVNYHQSISCATEGSYCQPALWPCQRNICWEAPVGGERYVPRNSPYQRGWSLPSFPTQPSGAVGSKSEQFQLCMGRKKERFYRGEEVIGGVAGRMKWEVFRGWEIALCQSCGGEGKKKRKRVA